jgi:ferritin
MSIPVPAVVEAIEKQLTHELYAANCYLAMAYWCQVKDWDGFGKFFHRQAGEEREHAGKLLAHLVDRGVLPRIGALPAPRHEFPSLIDIARTALELERTNTAGINAAYAAALQHNDYPVQMMLQWFINEQVEEEAWGEKMVAKVERASCGGGSFYLDHHLEKELLGEK